MKNDIRQRLDTYEAQSRNPQQLSVSMETNTLNLSVDEVARRGITPHEQQALKDVSTEYCAIIDVLGWTSNGSSMIENEIAVPKGANVHILTVEDIKIEHRGYDRNTKDLVVCRWPDPLPLSKPPDMSARDWRELRTAPHSLKSRGMYSRHSGNGGSCSTTSMRMMIMLMLLATCFPVLRRAH